MTEVMRKRDTGKEVIQSAKTKKELIEAIEKIGTIKGSDRTYTSKELVRKIDRVFQVYEGRKVPSEEKLRSSIFIKSITNGGELGIRDKVVELLQEKDKQGRSSSIREKASNMMEKAQLNRNVRRAEKYEKLADGPTDSKYRAKYYSKAGEYRERAAELLGRHEQKKDQDKQLRAALNNYTKAAEYWKLAGNINNGFGPANAAYRIAERLGEKEKSEAWDALKEILKESREYDEREYNRRTGRL